MVDSGFGKDGGELQQDSRYIEQGPAGHIHLEAEGIKFLHVAIQIIVHRCVTLYSCM